MRNICYYTALCQPCQVLISTFFRFFQHSPADPAAAVSRRLCYFTTSAYACQYLFLLFLISAIAYTNVTCPALPFIRETWYDNTYLVCEMRGFYDCIYLKTDGHRVADSPVGGADPFVCGCRVGTGPVHKIPVRLPGGAGGMGLCQPVQRCPVRPDPLGEHDRPDAQRRCTGEFPLGFPVPRGHLPRRPGPVDGLPRKP